MIARVFKFRDELMGGLMVRGPAMRCCYYTASYGTLDPIEEGLVHYTGCALVGTETLCGHVDRTDMKRHLTMRGVNCHGCIAVVEHVTGKSHQPDLTYLQAQALQFARNGQIKIRKRRHRYEYNACHFDFFRQIKRLKELGLILEGVDADGVPFVREVGRLPPRT